MQILIKQVINSPSAIWDEEGFKVFDLIKTAFSKNQKVELSFQEIEDVSTAFLNCAIGNLYIEFDKQAITSHISYTHTQHLLLLEKKLDKAIKNALDYKYHDELIDTATN